MNLKPKEYIRNENGRVVLADENKIHISEAQTFVSFERINAKIEECKIRWEGKYSNMDFYLHKADFIEHCINNQESRN